MYHVQYLGLSEKSKQHTFIYNLFNINWIMITNYHASVVDNILYYSFAETGSFRVSSCNFDWYTQWAMRYKFTTIRITKWSFATSFEMCKMDTVSIETVFFFIRNSKLFNFFIKSTEILWKCGPLFLDGNSVLGISRMTAITWKLGKSIALNLNCKSFS